MTDHLFLVRPSNILPAIKEVATLETGGTSTPQQHREHLQSSVVAIITVDYVDLLQYELSAECIRKHFCFPK